MYRIQGSMLKAFIVGCFIVPSLCMCMDDKTLRDKVSPLLVQDRPVLPLPIEIRRKIMSECIGLCIDVEKIKLCKESIASLNLRTGILTDIIFFDQQQVSGFNVMVALIAGTKKKITQQEKVVILTVPKTVREEILLRQKVVGQPFKNDFLVAVVLSKQECKQKEEMMQKRQDRNNCFVMGSAVGFCFMCVYLLVSSFNENSIDMSHLIGTGLVGFLMGAGQLYGEIAIVDITKTRGRCYLPCADYVKVCSLLPENGNDLSNVNVIGE